MVIQRQHGRAMIVMTAVAMVLMTLISPVAPAQAVQTQDGTTNYDATFYAYVAKGERMRLLLQDHSALNVYNEDGSSVPVDQNGYTPTAKGDGVWRITGNRAPDVRGFTYDMSVRAGTTEKTGRIFVYEDSLEQTEFGDLTYFGVSDLGYVYKIMMPQSKAWTTKIALRSSGPAPDKKCNVENRSFDASTVYLAAYLDCGDKYRLFFEDPRNSGLPETAKMANKTVQVLPKLVNSSQLTSSTRVRFAPNAAGGGIFNVDSHANFSGTADLQIDTNNNGTYTDAVDVEQTAVINQGSGLDWEWDGKDAKGVQVRNGAKARAVITKGGEAHLMVHDAEDFGGLTMTRLNGDAPDSKIYWDDSKLLRERGGVPTPVETCLNGCNSNVAGGVHGWAWGKEVPGLDNSGSWGDGTLINNWAYASVNATSPTIGLPKVYTLKFDGTGGKVEGSEITRTDGFAWGTLATASASNQDFLGWHTTKTSGGAQVTAATVATGNTTAYARWQVTPRTLTFDANGGSISGAKSITKPHGSAWGTLAAATLANSDFQGWFTTKAGGTQVTAATVATGNITVYAQWKLTPRTLTFDATGGSISGAKSITKPHGSPWGTLPTAAQGGKVFLNWHTAKAGGYQVTANSVATGSITAYAQWRPAKFNVVFHGNAQMGKVTGSTASVMVESGCTECKLPANGFSKTTGAPELIDHDGETAEVNSTFLGWSLDPLSHTGSVADRAVAGNLSVTDGATVRLYAIWDDAPRFIITDYPDRFFDLTQAKAGAITEAELLSTVKAADKETIPLPHKTRAQVLSSGSDVGVTVLDYDAKDYTSLTDSAVVTATYKVKDEVGHVAFLRIRVSVSDESPLAPSELQYFRGISPRFADLGVGAGGLSAESLWRTDPSRQSALAKALQGGSATTYCLDAGAIAELRAQVGGGIGNSKTPNGLAASESVLREKGVCP